MYPACFPNEKQYREWLYLARVVRESSTICDDCTKTFEDKMKSIGRCYKDIEQQKIFARSLDIKQRTQSEQLDLLEILFQSQENGSNDKPWSSWFSQRDGCSPYGNYSQNTRRKRSYGKRPHSTQIWPQTWSGLAQTSWNAKARHGQINRSNRWIV